MKTVNMTADQLLEGASVTVKVADATISGIVTSLVPTNGDYINLRIGSLDEWLVVKKGATVQVEVPTAIDTFHAFPLGQVFRSSGNSSCKYIKIGRDKFVVEGGGNIFNSGSLSDNIVLTKVEAD